MIGFGFAIIVILIILVVAVVGVITWVLKGQAKLVHADELCGNAMSQIGVQQASRWDALTALADLTQQYSQQEYDTLMSTIRARQGLDPKSTAQDVDKQEQMLQAGLGRINALAEAYPDLKANTLYLKTMDQVKDYEDKVRMSRMVYNDSVTKFNKLVRTMPGSFLAGGLGFTTRDYLQADAAKDQMPVLSR